MSLNSSCRTAPKKEFHHAPLAENIPISFGGNFHDDPICRSSLRKAHALELNVDVKHDPHTSYNFIGVPGGQNGLLSTHIATSSTYGAAWAAQQSNLGGSQSSATSSRAPQADESVLRFLAYTVERVPESPDEQTRVRKLALVYHVADGTIAIREAVQPNSGMPQGPFLKRQQVPHASGESGRIVGLQDLGIGVTVNVFGRDVNIVDMDEFSRRYFREKLGRSVPDMAMPWPDEDTYNTRVAQKLQVQTKKRIPTHDMDHKRAIESLNSGGIISKHAPDDIAVAQQFYANNINEHLQFACLWDDRDKKSGDLHQAVLKYFLENDTIEVVEKREVNCGREGAAKILCRQRVLRDGASDASAQQNTYGMLFKRNFVTFNDLAIGQEIVLHGKKFLIFDADAFTREWYRKNHNRELGAAVDVTPIVNRDVKPAPKQYPPPHDGFGSEEDSLRNWKSLLLKPNGVNRSEKQIAEEGKVMVFSAELDGQLAPEDVGRQFIISFHRATDEVEVQERQLRNSGIMGGKVLAKGRHLKPLPDGRKVPYTPADFVEGSTVFINGRVYRLTELDARSKKQIEGVVDPVSEDRLRELIILLRELLQSKFYRLHEGYRVLAPEGALTMAEVKQFFHRCAAPVTDEEAMQVVRYFTKGEGDGRLTYEQFAKMMGLPKVMTIDDFSNNPKSIRSVDVSPIDESYKTATLVAADSAQRARLKKTLIAKLVQRRGTVQEVFRLMAGHAPNARLSRREFVHALREILHFNVDKKEEAILVELLFGGRREDEELDFKTFHEFVESD